MNWDDLIAGLIFVRFVLWALVFAGFIGSRGYGKR